MCLEGVWEVSGNCLEGAWKVSRNCLEGVWIASGWCLDGIWRESGRCLTGVWKVSVTGQFGTGLFLDIFDQKLFLTKNHFWPNIIFDQKLFLTKTCKHIFLTLHFFDTIFWLKIVLDKNFIDTFYWIQIALENGVWLWRWPNLLPSSGGCSKLNKHIGV